MAKNKDRVRRDQAGIGPDPDNARRHHLVPMQELDGYTIADGEPDIRGWDVRTLNGREIGEIDDLLIDTDRGEVVMIDVELRDGGLHAEVPIRSVQLDREGRSVIVDSSDVDARHDQRPRDRLRSVERSEDVRDARAVTYGASETDEVDEVVVERRPVVEEVVVRRRVVDEE
jgi:sporulation protein YlmC with PRC-barrel domain